MSFQEIRKVEEEKRRQQVLEDAKLAQQLQADENSQHNTPQLVNTVCSHFK